MLFFLICVSAFSQGFVAEVESDELSVLFGNPCVATLATGEEVTGKLSGGSGVNGYLSTVIIKKDDGTKVKFKPEDVARLSIKASKLAKLAMILLSPRHLLKN